MTSCVDLLLKVCEPLYSSTCLDRIVNHNFWVISIKYIYDASCKIWFFAYYQTIIAMLIFNMKAIALNNVWTPIESWNGVVCGNV